MHKHITDLENMLAAQKVTQHRNPLEIRAENAERRAANLDALRTVAQERNIKTAISYCIGQIAEAEAEARGALELKHPRSRLFFLTAANHSRAHFERRLRELLAK